MNVKTINIIIPAICIAGLIAVVLLFALSWKKEIVCNTKGGVYICEKCLELKEIKLEQE